MSTSTDPILKALLAAQRALNELPRRSLNGPQKDTYEVASLVDEAVEVQKAKGYDPTATQLLAEIVVQYDAAPDGTLGKGFTDGPFPRAREFLRNAGCSTTAIRSGATLSDAVNAAATRMESSAQTAEIAAKTFPNGTGVGDFRSLVRDLRSGAAELRGWMLTDGLALTQRLEPAKAPGASVLDDADEAQYAFGEAVADLANHFAHAPEWPADSRERTSLCIEWAREFEKANAGVEWGVSDDREYLDAIDQFFDERYAEWQKETPAVLRIANASLTPAESEALPKADPAPTPFEIEVYDKDSAVAYLCALANSEYHYHIDEDPAGISWGVHMTRKQLSTLRTNTDAAFEQLGNEDAWAVYYGASVAAGKMALRDAAEEKAAAKAEKAPMPPLPASKPAKGGSKGGR